ncbi:hypothetical protein FRC08_012074 [Ceratobasidium sp. 394]|nr:hypothetical protein FRC08_012074 [Ceratobasidium sp. 394]
MVDRASPTTDIGLKLQSVFSELLEPQSNQSPESTAERIVSIAKAYVDEHSNDPVIVGHRPGSKQDTPGAEGFLWSLWEESLLKAIGVWDTDEQFVRNLDRAIGFVKALQARPEDELKWTVWGRDTSIRSLPLIGPSMLEANNGPFLYSRPTDDAFSRPEVQNALAGAAPPSTLAQDDNVNIALKRRKGWLALQAFIARLWSDVGIEGFAVWCVCAEREGLENWPAAPASIFDGSESAEKRPVGEKTPAYRALIVEGAAVWLRFAAPKMYACTKIWGPKGNPDWQKNEGAPGRGGKRWRGVDGMDKEKERWALWREVLKDVIAWYDREEVGGRGRGWKVKEAATVALEAMHNAQQK